MNTEQLPDGLQLSIKVLLEESARNELIGAPEAWNEELGGAIDAIRDEHAQRVTLQHHACDQAQRIADLEAKCDTLKRLHDAVAAERDELRARLLAAPPVPAQTAPKIEGGADYTLRIVADSGYKSETTGRCTANQYGAAIRVLHNPAPEAAR